MQTFLPSTDPVRCARILDSARLNKQRLEGLQILQALHADDHPYAHHPAVVMWRDHATALACWYLGPICDECNRRGIADHARVRDRIADFADTAEAFNGIYPLPWWMGNEAFHRSHRRNLGYKDEAYIRKFNIRYMPEGKPPYVWPVHANEYEFDGDIRLTMTRYTKPRVYSGLMQPANRCGHRLFITHQRNGQPVTYLLEKQ